MDASLRRLEAFGRPFHETRQRQGLRVHRFSPDFHGFFIFFHGFCMFLQGFRGFCGDFLAVLDVSDAFFKVCGAPTGSLGAFAAPARGSALPAPAGIATGALRGLLRA